MSSKDNVKNKEIQIGVFVQPSLYDIPESIIPEDKRLFSPNWNNKPPKAEKVLTFCGVKFLTTGNLSVIGAFIGVGKSGNIEALCSKYIAPDCDGIGWEVELKTYRNKILWLDCERSISDTWNSWERMMKRSGLSSPELDKRILLFNIKAIAIAERKKRVEELLNKNNDIGLVIFDGAGDFVSDTNSIPEATAFKDWISTFNPSISILVTLHTNPTDEKMRGNIGGELMRRSEGVMLLRKIEGGVYESTLDFKYGKARNDSTNVSHFYTWDTEKGMFVSTEYEKPTTSQKATSTKYVKLVNEIYTFHQKDILTFTELAKSIQNIRKCSENTAKAFVKQSLLQLLVKEGDIGYSKLKTNEGIF